MKINYLGKLRWPWKASVVTPANRAPLVMLNRYPGQIIGIAFRLPDGPTRREPIPERLDGPTAVTCCTAHATRSWRRGMETVTMPEGRGAMETTPRSEPPIIREQDGELDEVIAYNATVHIERINNVAWWIGITLPDGSAVHVDVGAVNQRAKPYATYWTEEATNV